MPPSPGPRSGRDSAARFGGGRAVVCWSCGEEHRVSLTATSTTCPACGEEIDLADVVIMEQRVRRIRTGGELRILGGAFLVAGDSSCGSLRLMGGNFAGRIRATGEARIESGEVEFGGELACHSLQVARQARVRFRQPLSCHEACIEGHFSGELICSGTVHLGKDAQLEGHCRAGSLDMAPGSVLAASITMCGGASREPRESPRPGPAPTGSPGPVGGDHQRQLAARYYETSLPRPV